MIEGVPAKQVDIEALAADRGAESLSAQEVVATMV